MRWIHNYRMIRGGNVYMHSHMHSLHIHMCSAWPTLVLVLIWVKLYKIPQQMHEGGTIVTSVFLVWMQLTNRFHGWYYLCWQWYWVALVSSPPPLSWSLSLSWSNALTILYHRRPSLLLMLNQYYITSTCSKMAFTCPKRYLVYEYRTIICEYHSYLSQQPHTVKCSPLFYFHLALDLLATREKPW